MVQLHGLNDHRHRVFVTKLEVIQCVLVEKYDLFCKMENNFNKFKNFIKEVVERKRLTLLPLRTIVLNQLFDNEQHRYVFDTQILQILIVDFPVLV